MFDFSIRTGWRQFRDGGVIWEGLDPREKLKAQSPDEKRRL